MVNVGIVSAQSIRFHLNGIYIQDDNEVSGVHEVHCSDGVIQWQGQTFKELIFKPQATDYSFSIEDVVIGVNFHWERKQTQTFLGSLRIIVDGDKLCAINTLPVERYLESVISSEMSSTSSSELLKAHAVISRSWLLAMLEKEEGRRNNDKRGSEKGYGIAQSDGKPNPSPVTIQSSQTASSLIKWYDREDHTLFDVCADDHCQRYQGITNANNPHVVEAVSTTRGQILTYKGEICDTRFSKCCGGITEEYQYCWDNITKPYLRSVTDPYCNTDDRKILSEVLNDYDQETIDFYNWSVEYTQEQLSELISRKRGIDFGRIRSLEPVERGKSGRITLLRIVGEKHTMVIGKELEIRKTLSESHLYSSWFTVEESQYDADGFPKRFVINGRGWGHGVGLCQIGAAVMGAKGIDYKDILTFYYPGAEITSIS